MRKLTWLLLLSLLLTVSGCALLNGESRSMPPQNGDRPPAAANNLRETVFYLPNADWQSLVPVRMGIPWETGIAKATLGLLVEGNVPQKMLDLGLGPLLPAGTTVLGLTIRQGVALVDLSKEFLNYNPAHEQVVIYGLVYTLTEFPSILQVELLVEGKKPDLPGGMQLSERLSRKDGLNLEFSTEVRP